YAPFPYATLFRSEVTALHPKPGVWSHLDAQQQIAGLAAEHAGRSLAGQPDHAAVRRAGGDLDVVRLRAAVFGPLDRDRARRAVHGLPEGDRHACLVGLALPRARAGAPGAAHACAGAAEAAAHAAPENRFEKLAEVRAFAAEAAEVELHAAAA